MDSVFIHLCFPFYLDSYNEGFLSSAKLLVFLKNKLEETGNNRKKLEETEKKKNMEKRILGDTGGSY